jgi:outer membrane protein TolC
MNALRFVKMSLSSTGVRIGGILLLISLLTSFAAAQALPADDTPSQATTTVSAQPLNLAGCLELAQQRNPRLAANRASLAAAQAGQRSIEELKVPDLVEPQLPIRRRQASRGVAAAAAGLDQAERQVTYAVTRTYFSVVYAREQERLARSVLSRLTAIQQTAQDQVNAGAANVTTNDVKRTTVYLRLAEGRRIQATQGVERALAGLKEAIGAGPDLRVDVALSRLPEPTVQPVRDDIVAWALARRGELIQASLFAEIACLEVEAQRTTLHKRVSTFAAGADIHSRPVPPDMTNSDYRPGGVPPEMPTLLAGPRDGRVEHARDLHDRAIAVTDVTRNLIALEAEDAFLRWQEAALGAAQARDGADNGDELANDLTKDFTSRLKVRVEDVVNARVLAAQARQQYNEYLYRQILALADLERITAGAFSAGLIEVSRANQTANK